MKVSDLCRKYGFRMSEFEKFASAKGVLKSSFGETVIDDSKVADIAEAYERYADEQEAKEAAEEEQKAETVHQVIKPSSVVATEATMLKLLETTQKIHFWIKFWSVLMIISIIIVILGYFGLAASISNYMRY